MHGGITGSTARIGALSSAAEVSVQQGELERGPLLVASAGCAVSDRPATPRAITGAGRAAAEGMLASWSGLEAARALAAPARGR